VIFRREPLHTRLAREGGLTENAGEDTRAPWDKAGIHGVHRPREWDDVATVEAEVSGHRATFVVLDDDRILIEDGSDDVESLADALSLDAPFRAEAVRRSEGIWAVAGRRIEVVALPGVDGTELELTRRAGERTFVVDGERRFGSIPALERDGDHTIRARRLDGDLWETEASLL
jgi:hypothetical protein